jgi:hypothetical protein
MKGNIGLSRDLSPNLFICHVLTIHVSEIAGPTFEHPARYFLAIIIRTMHMGFELKLSVLAAC